MKVCVAIGKHTGRAPNSEEVKKKAFSATFRAFFSTKPGYHKKSSGIHDLASNTISQLKKRNIIFCNKHKKKVSLYAVGMVTEVDKGTVNDLENIQQKVAMVESQLAECSEKEGTM